MSPTTVEILGTALFAIAVLHTFFTKKILDLSHKFAPGSTAESLLHLAGEIEVVFGIWAALFLLILAALEGFGRVVEYQNSLHFTEPIFVFCIMVMAATRPVLWSAQKLIESVARVVARVFKTPQEATDIFVLLVLGPLAGSLITEPAAMTVSALLLAKMIKRADFKMMYAVLAVLFVNVSIGGALTPFAAPPILMVAGKWGWGLWEVFDFFGFKSIIAVFLNSAALVGVFWKKWDADVHAFRELPPSKPIPAWVVGLHLLFLVFLVLNAHHANLAMGVFLFFLGVTTVTKKFQEELRLRESLLVAFFLGGIIVFGPLQAWWLSPLLKSLDATALFFGATALTAITDNAALTFLGSQVESLSDSSKYNLVAGAIAGGGLTIIANAPNAAGFTILQDKFPGGVHPGKLFVAALIPTAIACLCLGFLPSF